MDRDDLYHEAAMTGKSLDEIQLPHRVKRLQTALDDARTRVKALESQLTEARAAAVQWVTYDGTPGTLPAPVIPVLVRYAEGFFDTSISCFTGDFDEGWYDHRLARKQKISTGDRWAYLPTPPETSK